MQSQKQIIFSTSLPQNPKGSQLRKRRATIDKIKAQLQFIELFHKNRTMADSRIHSSLQPSEPLCNQAQASMMSSSRVSQNRGYSFEDNYEILEKLGEGSSGVVYRCVKRATDETYAVKLFTFEDEHVAGLKSNFSILKRLQHPFIIKYYGLYLDFPKRSGHLVMEYVDVPSLTKAHLTSEEDFRNVMYQLLMVLYYLHKQDIVHRDIKPENILYDSYEKVIKLIDFGISRRYRKKGNLFDMLTITGTLQYRAPEMFGRCYQQGVDIWAAGVLLYKLVCGRTPFQSQYVKQTVLNIKNAKLFFPPEFNSYSAMLKQLIIQMLNRDPSQRLSAQDCLKDIWFYTVHKFNENKKCPGSLKVIKDDTWNNFEIRDQLESTKESQSYEPSMGSLRFIVDDSDPKPDKKKLCKLLTRKMSQDSYAIDTDFDESSSPFSFHSLQMIPTMRTSGFF